MPRTPTGKGGERRNNAVVLIPAREGTTGKSNTKGRDDSENGHGGSWGGDGNKGGSSWGRGKGEGSVKGQAKGKGKNVSKVNEEQPAADAKSAATQPRIRDEIQEEVDSIVSINSNLLKTDFDGRVFQYLHAIHGVGGQERVRKALEIIHLSTLQKQRSSIKKWPAYLATLLRKNFEEMGAEKRQAQDRAKIEAENYGKQLSLSIDALFDKPVEISVPGGPSETTPRGSGNAANPQEAQIADKETPPKWLQQGVTQQREQQWLKRGSDLLLSALSVSPESDASGMSRSPHAISSIPPGFTPPQMLSPTHAHGHGSLCPGTLFAHPPSPAHLSYPPANVFAPMPPAQPSSSAPPLMPPPPPPPPQVPLQAPPPPPTAIHAHDPYKQQSAPLVGPPPPSAPVLQSLQGPPKVISPPVPPTNGNPKQPHQPRVVPPPRRQRSENGAPLTKPPGGAPAYAANVGAPLTKPPPPPTGPPPTGPPTQASDAASSWSTKPPMLPPPWPAQYVAA